MVSDYYKLIDSFRGIACIVSRRKTGENGSPEYVISAANKNYLSSVDKLDEAFVPDRPYTYYIAYDPNFEALVSTCISTGKISHQYVNADLYRAWLDLYMIPLDGDENGNGYCLFTYEMNFESDTEKMIDISAKTAYMVLKTCIKLRENDDFEGNLDSIVRDIRNQCESDGCAIILTDQEKRKIDFIFLDHSEENLFAPRDKDIFFKPEFYMIVEKWQDILGGTNCCIVSDKNELEKIREKDVNWYNSLIHSGVENLVLYPLRVGVNLYGYIFATNFNSDKTAFIREVMELNSFVLSAEVENFRMRQKLEMLGRIDMLTGVQNRNAMTKRVAALKSDTEEAEYGLGVIFADLNGLKMVNDTLGHNAGDEMLKNVASRLRSLYEDKDIYRAGGDEFLMIITDMKRDEFYDRFERLKALSALEEGSSFAVGAHYDDVEKDITAVMQTADQNMYRNKADYYNSNPKLNRRRLV